MHRLISHEFIHFAEKATSQGFVTDMLAAIQSQTMDPCQKTSANEPLELNEMMQYLAGQTGYDLSELRHDFARYLFGRFTQNHSDLFRDQTTAFDFLEYVETYVHQQVRDKFPNSVPPVLNCRRDGEREMVLHYQSNRPFADLCTGLLEAALEHFGTNGRVDRQLIGGSKSEAVFKITTQP